MNLMSRDPRLRISDLAPADVTTVAAWQHEEWGAFVPGDTPARRAAILRTRLGATRPPLVLVASAGQERVGTVGLVAEGPLAVDVPGPWMEGLYVVPHRRGRGFGAALARAAMARAAGERAMYLVTAGLEGFYARLGWTVLATCPYPGGIATLMRWLPGEDPVVVAAAGTDTRSRPT
jgi:predicted N-acetyltransferase YhbS